MDDSGAAVGPCEQAEPRGLRGVDFRVDTHIHTCPAPRLIVSLGQESHWPLTSTQCKAAGKPIEHRGARELAGQTSASFRSPLVRQAAIDFGTFVEYQDVP